MSSYILPRFLFIFFFFNDTATTEIYTLSLHDALPILTQADFFVFFFSFQNYILQCIKKHKDVIRSEEHTSELQSHLNLVCRLLLEKKKKTKTLKISEEAVYLTL